eukprot:TRINITY_DN24399_c0_g1_i1.p1 TRINITY_DN24399_c0_g1~~TRINITY_DN24399_c0_g1_i1.p1  ORF type:complete len:160 (+),score=27.45 TRINITY_DN24399_c0_g1_i1:29-481(+)
MPIRLVILPDHNGKAKGTFIVDNQEAVDPIRTGEYRHYSFELTNESLTISIQHDYSHSPRQCEKVQEILLLNAPPKLVAHPKACLYGKTNVNLPIQIQKIKEDFAIYIPSISVYLNSIKSIQFGKECQPCLLYTSPSPRDLSTSRMPSSA